MSSWQWPNIYPTYTLGHCLTSSIILQIFSWVYFYMRRTCTEQCTPLIVYTWNRTFTIEDLDFMISGYLASKNKCWICTKFHLPLVFLVEVRLHWKINLINKVPQKISDTLSNCWIHYYSFLVWLDDSCLPFGCCWSKAFEQISQEKETTVLECLKFFNLYESWSNSQYEVLFPQK